MNNDEYSELLDMVVTKITEYGIQEQRENVPEIDTLIKDNTVLSVKVKKVIEKLEEASREILVRYYEQSEKIADEQIKYLYIQGAKDCIQLLKKLGVL